MVYAIVVVLILIMDQGMKYWISLTIGLNEAGGEIIKGVLSLTRVHNTGAAFSILENQRWLLVGISVVFSLIVVFLLARRMIDGAFGRWTAILVLAGSLGNCIDRVLNGYVIDMFKCELTWFSWLSEFPIFNVADVFITVGGILFCIYVLTHKEEPEPRRVKAGVPERDVDEDEDDSEDDNPLRNLPPIRTPRARKTREDDEVEAPAPTRGRTAKPRQEYSEPQAEPQKARSRPVAQSGNRTGEPGTRRPASGNAQPAQRSRQQTERPRSAGTASAASGTARPRPVSAEEPIEQRRRTARPSAPTPKSAAPTKKGGGLDLDDILAEFGDD